MGQLCSWLAWYQPGGLFRQINKKKFEILGPLKISGADECRRISRVHVLRIGRAIELVMPSRHWPAHHNCRRLLEANSHRGAFMEKSLRAGSSALNQRGALLTTACHE